MPAPLPPRPTPRRASGEYGYVAREEQPVVPSEKPAPERSMSPPPGSVGVAVRIDEKGFDAKVRGSVFRRLAPWLVPALMSLLGTLGGGVLGYFEGLKRAAARVAALELQVDASKELLRQQSKDLDRFFVLARDNDRRLLTVERALKVEPPLVVKP